MSKISKVRISNFKSIVDFEADFKGCTALVTGGNNAGKSSFLKGLPDRIRFIRPDLMVRQGEKEGSGEMILTTGEKFVWEFNNSGKDKLTLITTEGLKHSVTTEIGRKFFRTSFDIDKFLQSSPKQQVKQLQEIVGLDFTEIDKEYDKAYNYRTERNREAELYHVKLSKMLKCDPVEFVDITDLKKELEVAKEAFSQLYAANKKSNESLRNYWLNEKARIDKEVNEFNDEQRKKKVVWERCIDSLNTLTIHGYTGDAIQWVSKLGDDVKPERTPIYPKEPTYIEEMPDASALDTINKKIIEASETNAAAQKYKEYIDHKKATEDARALADDADLAVKSIEERKRMMIESVQMPEGVSFGADGILVDGLPLDKNQLSTSKLYCAALRIAAMNLGQVKTLYFDASFLDRNSLAEIESWAESNDLQLLIERPDFDGGEIRYEIIETSSQLQIA